MSACVVFNSPHLTTTRTTSRLTKPESRCRISRKVVLGPREGDINIPLTWHRQQHAATPEQGSTRFPRPHQWKGSPGCFRPLLPCPPLPEASSHPWKLLQKLLHLHPLTAPHPCASLLGPPHVVRLSLCRGHLSLLLTLILVWLCRSEKLLRQFRQRCL
jgi:hypothetical protein